MAKVEKETRAKQGDKSRSTLVVLVVGIALAVVAAVGMLTWQSAKSPSDPASSSLEAAREKAPGGSPSPTPSQQKAQ